jgi:hypothetical protein
VREFTRTASLWRGFCALICVMPAIDTSMLDAEAAMHWSVAAGTANAPNSCKEVSHVQSFTQ